MTTLVASGVVTALACPAARRLRGSSAAPCADRWHVQVTPTTGGYALIAGALAGMLLSVLVWHVHMPIGLLAGVISAFVLGAIDDVHALRARTKLAGQLVAASAAVALGVTPAGISAWIGVPVSIFVLVACMNSLNLLDNMDGLAAGIACISALSLAAVAAIWGGAIAPAIPLAIAGACLGYLPFNFRPGRSALIFMGDAGSLGLGLALGACAIGTMSFSSHGSVTTLVAPLLCLSIMVFDTTFISIVRAVEGRPVWQGGRDHTSHRMVFAGLSDHHAVMSLIGIGIATGAAGALTAIADDWLVAAPSAGIATGLLLAMGRRLSSIDDPSKQPADTGNLSFPDGVSP